MPLGVGNALAAATGPRLFGEFSLGSAGGGVGYSVLQSRQGVTVASSTSTVVNITNPPVLGQLLVASCAILASTAGLTLASPTDNGSNTWTQIQSTQSPANTGNNRGAVWYRVATAIDVASLTAVTFNYSGATVSAGGVCCVDHFGGFSAAPTLDLSALPVTGTATTTGVISLAAVAARATELSVVVLTCGAAPGALTGVNQYSPNNGASYFTLGQTGLINPTGVAQRSFATAVATASSPATWQTSWTTSRTFAAFAFTFYG